MTEERPKPPFLWSLLNLKCPRCRRGHMFKHRNPYKKLSLDYMLDSFDRCPVCEQKYKPEPGFWFGTSYVSYGLLIVISAVSFGLWWLVFGISANDYRLFYWLIANTVLLFLLQPYMMRLSRVVFLSFFVKYDPHFIEDPPKELF